MTVLVAMPLVGMLEISSSEEQVHDGVSTFNSDLNKSGQNKEGYLMDPLDWPMDDHFKTRLKSYYRKYFNCARSTARQSREIQSISHRLYGEFFVSMRGRCR